MEKVIKETAPPPPGYGDIAINPSTDDLLVESKRLIAMTLKCVRSELLTANGGAVPSRTCIQALNDSVAMLLNLMKKEHELLQSLSDEELQAIAQENK